MEFARAGLTKKPKRTLTVYRSFAFPSAERSSKQ